MYSYNGEIWSNFVLQGYENINLVRIRVFNDKIFILTNTGELLYYSSYYHFFQSQGKLFVLDSNEWVVKEVLYPQENNFKENGMVDQIIPTTISNKAFKGMGFRGNLGNGRLVGKVISSDIFNKQIYNIQLE